LFVVCRLHRIESRRKPPEGGPTERSSFFFSVLIQLYRMRLREVVEKRWSLEISSPSISNSNETRIYRSESLPASACSFCSRHTRPPSCLMGSFGTNPSETYDRRRKGPLKHINFIWCSNVAVFQWSISPIEITSLISLTHA
jgi:hypothetical protein